MPTPHFASASATRADDRTVTRLAEIAETAPDRAHYEGATLACLRESVTFDVGFFVRDDAIGEARMGLIDEVVETSRARIARYGRELAPVMEVARAQGVAVDREVLGSRLERTRLFREFVAPHRGHSSVLVPLSFRRQTLGLLVLGRRSRGFRSNELGQLRRWLPVLRVCEASRGHADTRAVLTPRERDVLDYLCLGYSNREIAEACDSSVNTVRNQLQSAYRKLGASNRAEAVGIVLRPFP